jgi:hypothetical protein
MLGYRGPAQPSPTLGDALNAGFVYLEVRGLGCDTHQAVVFSSCVDRKSRRYTNWSAHALQGLLAGARLSLQAKPSSSTLADQDFCQ